MKLFLEVCRRNFQVVNERAQRTTGIMEQKRNTSAARRNVLLDPLKFITPDGKSNGVVRKQRPLGTCTTSFRFNTAICFGLLWNGDVAG